MTGVQTCALPISLFFLDYIGAAKVVPEQVAEIVSGVAEGCRQAGCALIGGETAELPGLYSPGEYDLAGFAVGVVEKQNILDGSNIKPGDVLVGLPSNGLHSNGYSLIRKLVFELNDLSTVHVPVELGVTVGEELLRPTRIYVKSVLPLVKDALIKGMVHVTGGGFIENLPRVLPDGLGVSISLGSWPILPVFSWLQQLGGVELSEMFGTFNMGIGFVLVVSAEQAELVVERLATAGEKAYIIGQVKAGAGVRFE